MPSLSRASAIPSFFMDAIHVLGKGRRERVLPLWKETRAVLRDWLRIRPTAKDEAVFLNARGEEMSRHGFASRLATHVRTAQRSAPTLACKKVTPHVLRHTCAVHTLEATGDIRRVALWLGHSSVTSTEIYLRIDPTEKLDILDAGVPPQTRKGTFTGVSDSPVGDAGNHSGVIVARDFARRWSGAHQ
jgi:integrase/recombinase XerD